MKEWLNNLLNQHGAVRRSLLAVTLWMTWRSFCWAATFASVSTFDGTGTAAVIAAVLAPIAYLQKAVFDAYLASRREP